MQQRILGREGPRIPVIGLGAFPIGGTLGSVDEAEAVRLIRFAIDHGVTLVDTAQNYRTSEELVGRALRNGYRERCFLCTKASHDFSSQGMVKALENSLRALGTDYVDLYQIHRWEPRYPIDASMDTLLRFQEQGKARFIGVSNFNAEQMAAATGTGSIQSNQSRLSLFRRKRMEADLPFCAAQGIGYLAHSPLAKGLLAGKYKQGHQFARNDARSGREDFREPQFSFYLGLAKRLEAIAREKSISLVQLAIAWVLSVPGVTCALCGAKSVVQVKEHAGAASVSLSEAELLEINHICRAAQSS